MSKKPKTIRDVHGGQHTIGPGYVPPAETPKPTKKSSPPVASSSKTKGKRAKVSRLTAATKTKTGKSGKYISPSDRLEAALRESLDE